jgi:hypothetical protein
VAAAKQDAQMKRAKADPASVPRPMRRWLRISATSDIHSDIQAMAAHERIGECRASFQHS